MIYGLATALNRLVKIVLVPIIAKSYPAEIYGAFDTLNLYLYVAAALAILGLNSSVIIVATADGHSASSGSLRPPAATCLRVVMVAALLVSLAIIAGATTFSRLLLGSPRFAVSVAWAAASVPFSAVLLYTLSVLQWSFRRLWYVGVALGTAVMTIGLTYVAARFTAFGLSGFFAANLCGQALGASVAVYAARDLVLGPWQRAMIRRLFAIGWPFAVISVAGGLLPSIGRYFLVHYHTLADTGIFALAQKIATLLTLVLAGFQAAWGPFAFARRGDPDRPRLFAAVFVLVVTLVVYLSVLLTLGAPWLSAVAATASYEGATEYVGPLALSAGMTAVFAVVGIGSVMEGRSLHNLTAYGFGLVVTLGANLILAAAQTAPIGIAWAGLGGQVAAVAAMAILAQRTHPMPFPFVRSAVIVAVGALLVNSAGRWTMSAPAGARVVAMLAGSAVTALWIWYGILTAHQRALWRQRVAWYLAQRDRA